MATATSVTTAVPKLYWADAELGKIRRANLDGTDSVDVLTGLDAPGYLVLDGAAEKLYWVSASFGEIYRANTDGSGFEQILATSNIDRVWGIALDPVGRRLYWTLSSLSDGGVVHVQRADLDGSNLQDLGLTVAGTARGIALDYMNHVLYWMTHETIQRADLDGSPSEELVSGLNNSTDLILDPPSGKMYWGIFSDLVIMRANIDGSAPEVISEDPTFVHQLLIDPVDRKLYWCDGMAGVIGRTNLDGSESEDVMTGLSAPLGIALDRCGAPRSIDTLSVSQFSACVLGPGVTASATCICNDYDGNAGVDLVDFAVLQLLFRGDGLQP